MTGAATGPASAQECEAWFTAHGLPWFVAAEEERIRRALHWRRLWRLAVPVGVVALVAGLVAGIVMRDAAAGLLTALTVMGVAVAAYAATVLRGAVIARWAVRRTLADVGVMFPLVTRALPLLLLFTTFLFINTEVWQVASSLTRSVLWTAVLLFAGVGIAFLLVRLPEELRQVVRRIEGDGADAALNVWERANLLLVLLVMQALQVLMLVAAVFTFFVVFGKVAISPDVIESWIDNAPTTRYWSVGRLDVALPISNELFQVSVFLAAFSGLYFTVYAVSDQTYREQFFTRISRQLERAVEVHARYVEARRPGGSPG